MGRLLQFSLQLLFHPKNRNIFLFSHKLLPGISIRNYRYLIVGKKWNRPMGASFWIIPAFQGWGDMMTLMQHFIISFQICLWTNLTTKNKKIPKCWNQLVSQKSDRHHVTSLAELFVKGTYIKLKLIFKQQEISALEKTYSFTFHARTTMSPCRSFVSLFSRISRVSNKTL